MPTIHSAQLPKPKNWQEFELLTRDALTLKWGSPNLQIHGRQGQSQSGIDIFGDDYIGRSVGIQCKLTTKELTAQIIDSEIKKAEGFSGNINTLFFATTADIDVNLQSYVRGLSQRRSALGKFAVAIIYWDEIIASLAINPSILSSHFPSMQIPLRNNHARSIAAVELGYFGAGLADQIELIFSEFGQMAGEDPDRIRVHTNNIRSNTQILFEDAERTEFSNLCGDIIDAVFHRKNLDIAITLAKRLKSRVTHYKAGLSEVEYNIIDLTSHLASIFHHIDEQPKEEIQSSIKFKCKQLLIQTDPKILDKVFLDAAKIPSGYRWSMKVYGFLEHEIRWQK
jgi:hypothetical protein